MSVAVASDVVGALPTSSPHSSTPDFPEEDPTREALDKWIDAWDAYAATNGYAPMLQGRDPPSVIQFTERDLALIPALPPDAGASAIAAREALRAQVLHVNAIKRAQRADTLCDHRHRFALLLIVHLRPRAGLRLQRLLATHIVSGTVGASDALKYDGIAMYLELRALRAARMTKPQRDAVRRAVVPDFATDYNAADAAAARTLPTDFQAPVPPLVDPTIDPAHWDPLRAGGLPSDSAGGDDTADPETAERGAHIQDPDTWRGRTRHGSNYNPAALLGGAVVAWRSRKQHSISMSSTEAEIIAASDCALELVYLRGLLAEMGFPQDKPTVLHVDNAGAVELSRDLKSCQRSRHVERRYLKVRELAAAKVVEVRFVPTADNVADAFTTVMTDSKAFLRHIQRCMNFS